MYRNSKHLHMTMDHLLVQIQGPGERKKHTHTKKKTKIRCKSYFDASIYNMFYLFIDVYYYILQYVVHVHPHHNSNATE